MSITLLQKDSFKFHKKASYGKFKTEGRLGIDCILDVIDNKLLKWKELKHHLLFIKGRTGSGKSTCMPSRIFKFIEARKTSYFLIRSKYKSRTVVNVIEPRVILAKSSVNVDIENDKYFIYGENIGYKTGSGKTLIKNPSRLVYMTTEIFRMMLSNGEDIGNVVIVDECHDLDIPMITLLREIKEYIYSCKDLRNMPLFIFTSATLGVNNIVEYYFKNSMYDVMGDIFADALMIGYVSGLRNYPVIETFLKEDIKEKDFVDWVLTEGINESLKSTYEVNGIVARDILIFVASGNFHKKFDTHKKIDYPIYKTSMNVDDVKSVIKWRDENRNKIRILIIPYSRICKGFGSYILSNTIDKDEEAQKYEIKIFISTNVVETGKTFNTWYQVYDCGLRYIKAVNPLLYNPKYNNIILSPIDKNSSIQRCGRVGRKTNGIAHRVFTREVYEKMQLEILPQNINLPSNANMLISCKKNDNKFIDPVKDNDYIFQNSFDTNLITGRDLVLSGFSTPWGEFINDVRIELVDQKWILEAEYLYYTKDRSLEDLLITCRNSRVNMSLILYDHNYKVEPFNYKNYDVNDPDYERISVILEARQEYVNFLVGVSKVFLKIK